MDKLLVGVEDAASRISMGKSYLWEEIRRGHIQTVKLGRRTLISVADLEAYVAQRRKAEEALPVG